MDNQAPTTFDIAYRQFRDDAPGQSRFDAACRAFLAFDESKQPFARLTILYILYALYAKEPLEQNPFLAFFLEFVGPEPKRGDAIEQHFIHCILEGTISNVQDCTPQEVYKHRGALLPTVQRHKKNLELLRRSVTQLVDDPFLNGTDDEAGHARNLLQDACRRSLNDAETLLLNNILHRQPVDTLPAYQIVLKIPLLVEHNRDFTANIMTLLLQKVEDTDEHIKTLLSVPATPNSLELVYYLLTSPCPRPTTTILHAYVSHCILSSERLEPGALQDQMVTTVAKFIQRLLKEGIIPIGEYLIEIQSFCVGLLHLRIGAVTALFRKVSAEARWVGQSPHAGPSFS